MANSTDKALQRRKETKKPPPAPLDSPTVSNDALADANIEAVRFLQDVCMEVAYADYAGKLTIQNFLRIRQLAFQDVFEDISEETKATSLKVNGEVTLESIRGQAAYEEIKQRFIEAAKRMSRKESGTEWLERVQERNRRNLERFARTSDKELMKDAGRAAAEILEREMPKASRAQIGTVNAMIFSPEQAALMARAFAENQIKPPAIPVESRPIEPEKKE